MRELKLKLCYLATFVAFLCLELGSAENTTDKRKYLMDFAITKFFCVLSGCFCKIFYFKLILFEKFTN